MGISYSAISCKGFLLGLLLICLTVFSSDAKPAGDSYTIGYQDKKRDNAKKAENPEPKKPDPQRVDQEQRGIQKPEIKEVPKSRKQLKPAVVKPKVKPVKIVRPKIKKH